MPESRRKISAVDRQAAKDLRLRWAEYQRVNQDATQATIENDAKISQAQFSQYLHCRMPLRLGAVLKLAKFFGVAPHEIHPDVKIAQPGAITAQQTAPPYGLSAEALEVARVWSKLPIAHQRTFRNMLYFNAAIFEIAPALLTAAQPASYKAVKTQMAKYIRTQKHETEIIDH